MGESGAAKSFKLVAFIDQKEYIHDHGPGIENQNIKSIISVASKASIYCIFTHPLSISFTYFKPYSIHVIPPTSRCCGALKENYCMICVFAVLLTIVFAMEIAAGVLGYQYRTKVERVASKGLDRAISNYDKQKVRVRHVFEPFS